MRAFSKSVVACGITLGLAAPAMAADMVVGVPNWPSAVATANVIKVVLEDNLGLEVELQNGTNAVFFEGMDAGSVHVHVVPLRGGAARAGQRGEAGDECQQADSEAGGLALRRHGHRCVAGMLSRGRVRRAGQGLASSSCCLLAG